MENGQYMYHVGGSEIWTEGEFFNTEEEAISAGGEYAKEEGYDQYETGKIELFNPFVRVDRIIEDIQDSAYDTCGEAAEGYLDDVINIAQDDLEERLNEVFQKWMDEYNYNPTCFSITHIKSHEVTGRS